MGLAVGKCWFREVTTTEGPRTVTVCTLQYVQLAKKPVSQGWPLVATIGPG